MPHGVWRDAWRARARCRIWLIASRPDSAAESSAVRQLASGAAGAGFEAEDATMMRDAARFPSMDAACARQRGAAARCAPAPRPSTLEEAILVRPDRLRYDRPLIAAQPSRQDGRSGAVLSFAGPESADRRHRQLAFSSNNNDPPVHEAARAARHEAPQ
ncbi:hypothetical protein C7S16_0776 [Burkholderia thailandensis]|uniref:Uncharacterized protein n=1 Tax=Burkholderia thailandensis TaxID=57975 RepID=A0AAW9D684_BURTH|nr:hypothetical protein [Burkholderia thailandensis]MDW9257494.1 hypothetical protein [Burkholderia thailandensis]